MQQVDPATVSVWRWQLSLVVGAVALGACIPGLVLGGWGMLIPVAVAAIGLPAVWFGAAAQYRNLRYGVDDAGILIHRGVLWHSDVALPRARIQHSDVSQGPLQRRYGVSTLKLYTAGSHHTKIELPGLAHDEALALRDALLGRDGSGV